MYIYVYICIYVYIYIYVIIYICKYIVIYICPLQLWWNIPHTKICVELHRRKWSHPSEGPRIYRETANSHGKP